MPDIRRFDARAGLTIWHFWKMRRVPASQSEDGPFFRNKVFH